MGTTRRDFLRFSGLAALGVGAMSKFGDAASMMGAKMAAGQANASAMPLEIHLLNRLTWGARPQDVERIAELGMMGYVEWQLAPEAIDDPDVDKFLEDTPIFAMSPQALGGVADEDYGVVYEAAVWGRIYRAVHSERQLYELMIEFWTDHFNIPIYDLLAEKFIDDRDVIRRHAMGNYRDLLLASAQSPAMLIYLDNAESDAERPNENYARELMELHTLGVDGGYTEADVVAVARILTGWTLREDWASGFFFDSAMHDSGEKVALGRSFAAGRGVEEGLELLDMLALHPSTARFISTKLIRRFVSDIPPAALIDSAAQVWIDQQGDIRSVLRHIFTSGEFMASAGQKFRRPLDFMVAAQRVYGDALDLSSPDDLYWNLEPMGHLPYGWQPPNGYPDAAGAWMNTNGLLTRWNVAMYLALGWIGEMTVNLNALVPQTDTAGQLVDAAAARILARPIAHEDRLALIQFVADSDNAATPISREQRGDKLPGLVGLIMASPYFQWH